MLLTYILILAYASASLSLLLVCIRLYFQFSYSEIDRLLDNYNGIKRTWPVMVPGLVFLFSFCYLIADWIS